MALSALALLAGCHAARDPMAGRARGRKASIAADSDRFPHGRHTGDDPRIRGYKGRGLQCEDCHLKEAVLAGEHARPGKNQHAPCDDCHRDEFYKPPGRFCQNCHVKVEPTKQGATTMQPYPERGHQRVLAAEFSHRVHLDKAAMDAKVGFHVICGDCHVREAESRDPMLPGHKECARCHVKEKAARAKLEMGDCSNCHLQRDVTLARGRIFITGDLVFAHKTHERDKAGKRILCTGCHDAVPLSRDPTDVGVPAMQRCATCHQDAAKTPERVRISNCGVCHQQISSGLAPRSHVVGQEIPEDHTIAFRKDHAEQAGAKDARCAFCHVGLSGSPRDSCYECHQVWRPRDHRMTWRDDEHGREAASDRDRCTICHSADYCTACHSVPPRSHQPFAQFRLGGHGELARFDLRACFACHTREDTCSDCHRSVR